AADSIVHRALLLMHRTHDAIDVGCDLRNDDIGASDYGATQPLTPTGPRPSAIHPADSLVARTPISVV
ncbi:MAG: hypothetical protein ABI440_06495, partial [Casimicrobiaceae bacterium]